MGSRRRPAHINTAAVLPASRLPLGTPTNKQSTAPTSQLYSSSFSSSSSNSPTKAQPAANPLKTITNTSKGSRIAFDNPSDISENQKSIADAKLERQRKRIAEAEAALCTASPAREKRNAPTSAPRKQIKHAGLPDNVITEPASEVRISSIRVVSRESSLARPPSVLSQRTSDTGTSETEPYDGYQVIRGRRYRKDELNPRGEKPEPRQTTVEATFDKREIYEAFGNALPTPEFIEEHPGAKNGQIQFVQHPNGDVAAHQWSKDRYMWENIGQFSNIRKRIEGQLASDRLKGEAAHQKLQQNTLPYFRTIAKQREALVMGVAFGRKDIQAAIPPTPSKDTCTASQESLKKLTPVPAPPTLPNTAFEVTSQLSRAAEAQVPILPKATPQDQPNILAYPSRYAPQMTEYPEDPFSTASSYRHIYGHRAQFTQEYLNPMNPKVLPSSRSHGGLTQHQLDYDFHFPPPGAASRVAPAQLSQSRGECNLPLVSMPAYPTVHDTAFALAGSQNPTYRSLSSFITSLPSTTSRAQSSSISVQARPDTPLGNRASMSDQLWKISETAKERNLSQTNITRTVLYDPYQKHPSMSTASRTSDTEDQNDPSRVSKSFASSALQQAQLGSSASGGIPAMTAPQPIAAPSFRGSFGDSLQHSSPNSHRGKKPSSHGTESMTFMSKLQATPQNFHGPFFPADPKQTLSVSSAGKKNYAENLNDWWTSGNKFARQEEFYQSLVAANKPKETAHLTPIGPPSRTPVKEAPRPFNPVTTRLLVPVLESLASYVQGPPEKRRDYFCSWTTAPEWAIDRGESGNNSFYDADWGQPPARVGRDPRYSGRQSWSAERTPPTGRFPCPLPGLGMAYPARLPARTSLDHKLTFGGRL